ncbi:sulfite exporter TauE/SafE family protein [Neisseria animaloris]|uniref:sulfite exporter TauE/SafE family protein n=1 Tax=Neisseria animaloris TaxID=326522 RepID=UPI0039DF43FD
MCELFELMLRPSEKPCLPSGFSDGLTFLYGQSTQPLRRVASACRFIMNAVRLALPLPRTAAVGQIVSNRKEKEMLVIVLSCMLLGAVAGFLAGLFGIGGGLVIVPVLFYLLPQAGVADNLALPIALGTSFSTIVITAFSASHRHYRFGNINWHAAKYLAPALIVAVFVSGLLAGSLPKAVVSKIFACLVIYLALKMLLSLKPSPKTDGKPLSSRILVVGGFVIGALSGMGGISGGAFVVPFLNGRGMEIKKAIGTASLCGGLLAVSATLSFVIGGWHVPNLPAYSFGYVYLPALAGIVSTSFFTSKLGANAANLLPVMALKRAFAVFLLLIALNMLLK